MDPINFYCLSSITLENIKQCATKAGYIAQFQNDDISGNKNLFIAFKSQKSPPYKAYWRWEVGVTDLDEISVEEKQIIAPIWEEVETVFTVWFSTGALDEFVEMLHYIFDCYNGYIFFEDALFNVENLASMEDHLPPASD